MASPRMLVWLPVALTVVLFSTSGVQSQEDPLAAAPPSSLRDAPGSSSAPAARAAVKPPNQVDVQPLAADEKIAARLERIMRATGWFEDARVRTQEGVVFLEGRARSAEHRQWAEELALSTQDVVAVVNQLSVPLRPAWDLEPAFVSLQELVREIILWLPFVLLALVILSIAGIASWGTTWGARSLLRKRIQAPLLREVAARLFGATVLIVGLYIVLRVSGLSRLALTVIGGTGLLGLVIGIAFRDITENFLASIFLSAQRPFRVGDLVEIAQVLGYVQRLTVRTTVLMTLDGNHVQIPNSIVYKSTLRNFSSNPNRREDFTVGIGYAVPIVHAQEVALAAVRSHPAVLKEPEPWVLADSLGPATVNLRVYFWLNGSEHSWLKIRSSVIRLVKRAFQDHGVEMPDEARELVFPRGVAVHFVDERSAGPEKPGEAADSAVAPEASGSEPLSTGAEAGLTADADQIQNQARQASSPEAGENLLARREA